jgi:hypothetical protein
LREQLWPHLVTTGAVTGLLHGYADRGQPVGPAVLRSLAERLQEAHRALHRLLGMGGVAEEGEADQGGEGPARRPRAKGKEK